MNENKHSKENSQKAYNKQKSVFRRYITVPIVFVLIAVVISLPLIFKANSVIKNYENDFGNSYSQVAGENANVLPVASFNFNVKGC